MDPTWWPSLLAYTSSSKVFQKLQKRFDNLITSSHIFFYKARISLSNDLEILNPLESSNNVASMLIISAIVVIKASHNSQWPFDWFMTHANTTKFKQNVIVLATIHTYALSNSKVKIIIYQFFNVKLFLNTISLFNFKNTFDLLLIH